MERREKRVILVGFAVLGIGLLVRMLALPYLERVRNAEALLARERERLAQERALVRSTATYRVAFDSLGTRWLSMLPQMMRGGSPIVVQAALSRQVDEAARAALVQLSRVELLPARAAGTGLVAMSLRLEGESDFEGFLTLLSRLEAGPTVFHIDELEVRGREQPGIEGIAGGGGITVVSFRFTVTGFALRGGEVAKTSRGPAPGAAGSEGGLGSAEPSGFAPGEQ
jgi:hypothetical protein